MNEHFQLLGFEVRDVVTKYTGVVTSVSFDLSGCVQAFVQPPVNAAGLVIDGRWVDTKRLEAISGAAVTEQPTFDVIPGGQDLPPLPQQKPLR